MHAFPNHRTHPFEDRSDAAEQLADALADQSELAGLAGSQDAIVLGLCRGGVPVAHVVAARLALPLDTLVVRKLPTPGSPELAMGAIAEHGAESLNPDILQFLEAPGAALAAARKHASEELRRRATLYRHNQPPIPLEGKTVLLVDDGAATGATLLAAIQAMRRARAKRVIAVLPVAPAETCDRLTAQADFFFCLWTPEHFQSVGACYRHFPQVTDADVTRLLDTASRTRALHEAESDGKHSYTGSLQR